MKIVRTVARAWSVLRTFKRAFAAPAPHEGLLAFEALSAGGYKGLMVDVGAHFGTTLAPFARNGWEIWAFEPDSSNRAKLLEGYAASDNVTVDVRALADQEQTGVTFYRSEQSSGISGLSAFHETHTPGENVDVTTLAHILDERGLDTVNIDFLKIDTEGFDLPVLKGIPWDRCAPRMILCEFEDLKTTPLGYTYHDMAGYLCAQGYRVIVSEWYPIKKYGGPHDWRCFAAYPHVLHDARAWGNLFAVREDGVYATLLELCKLAASVSANNLHTP